MLAVVSLSVVLVLTVVAVVHAYRESRLDADREDARHALVQRRIKALSDAVAKFRGDTRTSFKATGVGIGAAAKKTMGVLDSAIRREALKLEASNGRSRRTVAVMQALLDANDKALRELMVKLDVEDKSVLARFMREMEARHVEIVSYLSGGGLDRVADALQGSDIGTGADGFSQTDVRTTLSGMGMAITDADLAALDAGVRADVGKGLKKREALFVRLAAIPPVVARARELKMEDAKLKVDQRVADAAGQFRGMIDAEAVHRDAILGTMGARIAQIDDDVTAQIEKLRLTQDQSDGIKKMISDSLANVASARTALDGVARVATG